jgi:5-methylcytosine-specific restriction enzyme A
MRTFSKQVRRAAFARCGGACETCTAPLIDGQIAYDHVVPYELSRDSSIANLRRAVQNLPRHQDAHD